MRRTLQALYVYIASPGFKFYRVLGIAILMFYSVPCGVPHNGTESQGSETTQ